MAEAVVFINFHMARFSMTNKVFEIHYNIDIIDQFWLLDACNNIDCNVTNDNQNSQFHDVLTQFSLDCFAALQWPTAVFVVANEIAIVSAFRSISSYISKLFIIRTLQFKTTKKNLLTHFSGHQSEKLKFIIWNMLKLNKLHTV